MRHTHTSHTARRGRQTDRKANVSTSVLGPLTLARRDGRHESARVIRAMRPAVLQPSSTHLPKRALSPGTERLERHRALSAALCPSSPPEHGGIHARSCRHLAPAHHAHHANDHHFLGPRKHVHPSDAELHPSPAHLPACISAGTSTHLEGRPHARQLHVAGLVTCLGVDPASRSNSEALSGHFTRCTRTRWRESRGRPPQQGTVKAPPPPHTHTHTQRTRTHTPAVLKNLPGLRHHRQGPLVHLARLLGVLLLRQRRRRRDQRTPPVRLEVRLLWAA
jgi:hypothetical protein